MAWKSREDKMPPPSFFSMMVAYLQRAYPGAQISRELMLTLRPFLIEAWRNGRTAEAAAQTTCSCDGRQIIPSPVVAVHIAKGSVRPPKGAQRGEVFGADALRRGADVRDTYASWFEARRLPPQVLEGEVLPALPAPRNTPQEIGADELF
jgi:hypothetical protein